MDGLLHLVQRGGAWAGCGPAQSSHRCTKCNSPPINGQCTNHCMAIMMVSCSAVLMWRLKGWYTIAYSSRYCATARLIELLSSRRKARALRNGDIHLFVRWSVASRCAGSPTERPPPRVSQMFDRRENQPPPPLREIYACGGSSLVAPHLLDWEKSHVRTSVSSSVLDARNCIRSVKNTASSISHDFLVNLRIRDRQLTETDMTDDY